MEGLAPFLRRAREQHLIDVPKVAPLPPKRENEENEEPDVNAAFRSLSLNESLKLKSCLKQPKSLPEFQVPALPPHRIPKAPEAQSVLPEKSEPEFKVPALPRRRIPKAPEAQSVLPEKRIPKAPEAQSVLPEKSCANVTAALEVSGCQFSEKAFEGLPGMDVYRDVVASDSEGEEKTIHSTAEDADEEDQSEDSEQDALLALTSLIITTKKLSLGERKSKNNGSSSSEKNNNIGGRKNRGEVRERFIGRCENYAMENKRVNLTRQSYSEYEESDVGRASEVILSSFPLLPGYGSGKDENCDDTEVFFSPTQTIKEKAATLEKKQQSMEEESSMLIFDPSSPLIFSSNDDDDIEQDSPRAPPNTPLPAEEDSLSLSNESLTQSPVPLLRRCSVVYTPTEKKPEQPVFRRSSVVYSPCDKSLPQTPPKSAEGQKAKPPKTEAPQKTKSRIELASPLAVPPAQAGVHPGSKSVPAKPPPKSRLPPQFLPIRRLIAVADTNVLMSNLTLVENTQNYPNVTLVIPSAVVRELDGLKNGASHKARDARAALHSLRHLLKGAQSRTTIKFQNIDEVPKSRSYRGRTRSNDDLILDCCLYYAEMLEEGQKVVLLTNDVALQVKAESFGQGRNALSPVSAMGMRAFYEKEVWHLV